MGASVDEGVVDGAGEDGSGGAREPLPERPSVEAEDGDA